MNEQAAKKSFFRDSNIGQAWLILLMAIVFGALLAVVQIYLSPLIAANQKAETYSAIPPLVMGATAVPENYDIEEFTVAVPGGNSEIKYPVYQMKVDGATAGFVVKASIMGYADLIEILVGFNADISQITGIFVLYQKETPGLGNKILDPAWNGQFIGKPTVRPLSLGKDADTQIDAISGATISSVAVVNIVNNVVKDLRDALIKKAGE